MSLFNKNNENQVSENETIVKLKKFFNTYKIIIISLGLLLFVSLVFDAMFVSSYTNDLSTIRANLYRQENILQQKKSGTIVKQKVTREANVDISAKRWFLDDEVICDWINDAFAYDNLTEYYSHRNAYVEELGENHSIVKVVMPEVKVSGPAYEGGKYIGDAEDLTSSYIENFSSYVYGVDGTKITYSAKISVVCQRYDTRLKKMNEEEQMFSVLYTIDRPSESSDKFSINKKAVVFTKMLYERK